MEPLAQLAVRAGLGPVWRRGDRPVCHCGSYPGASRPVVSLTFRATTENRPNTCRSREDYQPDYHNRQNLTNRCWGLSHAGPQPIRVSSPCPGWCTMVGRFASRSSACAPAARVATGPVKPDVTRHKIGGCASTGSMQPDEWILIP